nr:YgeY family selenium metabolism-linked hydrolase [Anaerolineae bacterium]
MHLIPTEPVDISASLALTDTEKAAVTRFLQTLIRTPSHPTQETEVASLVEAELQKLGIQTFRDPVGNVIARLGNGSGPTLLYDAHMDTVTHTEAPWAHPPYDAQIEDDVLYGLGACDMKGAVAAMVYAAGKLVSTNVPLQGTLLLAFVVQEEPCEGCALKALVQHTGLIPDLVLLGEPSDMAIMRGHRGRVLFKVKVQGKSSHASSPELGVNAITGASRLIFGIDLLADELPSDPFLGPGTIAVTRIESQAPSYNAIPDSCTLYVDRRLTLGETPRRAQSQIEGVIEREGVVASIEIVEYREDSYNGYELQTYEAFNAWALDEKHPLVKTLSQVVQKVLGASPRIGHWPFSTDGVYSSAEAGIPTVGFGPGNPKHAHTVDDQVRLTDIYSAAHVYALLAAMLLR